MGEFASNEQLVTVVIPVRNEQDNILRCLESVSSQSYARLEILVVDGDSEDMTAAQVQHYAATVDDRVRLINNRERIIPSSLNLALRHASGELMVRVDGHSRLTPGYIERAVHHFSTGNWGGVGGRKDGVGHTSAGRAIAVAMSSPFGVGNSVYHYGTETQVVDHIPFGCYNVAIARSLGGWDERFRVNQDFEFDFRMREAGHELLFDPQMKIDWDCRQSVRGLLSQYVRYGRGKARVAKVHPKSMALRHLAPPLLLAWLVAGVATLPFAPVAGLAMLAPYVLGVVLASFVTARRVGRGDRRHLPLIFPAMHIGWGYGFCRGVVDILQGKLRPVPQRMPVGDTRISRAA